MFRWPPSFRKEKDKNHFQWTFLYKECHKVPGVQVLKQLNVLIYVLTQHVGVITSSLPTQIIMDHDVSG